MGPELFWVTHPILSGIPSCWLDNLWECECNSRTKGWLRESSLFSWVLPRRRPRCHLWGPRVINAHFCFLFDAGLGNITLKISPCRLLIPTCAFKAVVQKGNLRVVFVWLCRAATNSCRWFKRGKMKRKEEEEEAKDVFVLFRQTWMCFYRFGWVELGQASSHL